jgi:signal transduction histidine kinase
VDLAAVAAATIAASTLQAASGAVTLQADLRPARVSGEPVLLERMAGNLLDDALRYNHTGGHVTVSSARPPRVREGRRCGVSPRRRRRTMAGAVISVFA